MISAKLYYRSGATTKHRLSHSRDMVKNGVINLYNYDETARLTCTIIPLDIIQRVELIKEVDITEE